MFVLVRGSCLVTRHFIAMHERCRTQSCKKKKKRFTPRPEECFNCLDKLSVNSRDKENRLKGSESLSDFRENFSDLGRD